MDVFTRHDFPRALPLLRQRIAQGQLGLVPTGTLYALCVNALDAQAVRVLQQHASGAAAVVPHSLPWASLLVGDEHAATLAPALQRYRGHTTLWRYSSRHSQLPSALIEGDALRLTYPEHWITQLAQDAARPLLLSPVRAAEGVMRELDQLPASLRAAADFLVYEGPLSGERGALIHCHELPHRIEEARL
jgi:hypothetical protein